MYFFLFVYYHAWQTDEFHPNKNNDGTLLLEHLALFTPIEEAWQNWTVQFMIWKKKSTRYGTLLVQLYNIIYNAPASHFNISQVTQRNKEVHAKLRTNPKYYRVYINQSNPQYSFLLDSTNSHPLSLSLSLFPTSFFFSSLFFAWTERERLERLHSNINIFISAFFVLILFCVLCFSTYKDVSHVLTVREQRPQLAHVHGG